MAETNNHVQPKSLEEYSQLQQNNAEFAGLDKELGDNLTIFVHGTNSSPKDADQAFINEIAKTYHEKVIQFDWSGQDGAAKGDGAYNSTTARSNAASRLSAYIENYPFKEGEKLNIATHSHGGNAGKAFTNLYEGNKKVDTMVFLGVPVRDDYPINYKVFDKNAKILNVYDSSDAWQKLGGFDLSNFEIGGRRINDPRVTNIKVEVPNKVNLFNFISPLGAGIIDNLSNDHTDMDSAAVWKKINAK